MKKTLLELVQTVLNDMDADPVTTILETFESEQVADIVRGTFFNLIDGRNWPHLKRFITLTETTVATPTHITLPDTVKELIQLKYNVAKVSETQRKYKEIDYLSPEIFLNKTDLLNNDKSYVDVITDPSGGEVLIRNDKAPQWWTSFDDTSIVMDSYDSAVDTFIQASKTKTYAYVTPVWEHDDDHVPDLPEEAFTLLQEESTSTASLKLRQMEDAKSEQRSQKADAWLSRKAFVTKGGVKYPNYGRSANGYSAQRPHPLDKEN